MVSGREELERGRASYRRRAWAGAYEALSLADRETPLEGEDLERLATSTYLTGRDDEFATVLERAHHAYLEAGEEVCAARCAFWSGLSLLLRGEVGRATGWLARARRLVKGRDCVEQGFLLLPVAESQLVEGETEGAYATASEAASVGERFGDDDLAACARHLQGRALIRQGEVQAGFALLDEAMVSVTADELSPIVAGLIYCSVIETCRQACALDRAREWTSALADWCERQPGLIAFTATCLVHRAEVLRLSGAWPHALAEAKRACDTDRPPATAFYEMGELHRLRGELEAAEEAYRSAARRGRDPQPGLALLRMAQGRSDTARAGIGRAVSTAADPLERARLLPASVEILLAADTTEQARSACRELEGIAERFDTDVLEAQAALARGSVELAEGDARSALGPARRAFEVWRRVDAPYETARARVLIGLACRALGDDEAADLELAEARAAFERLEAAPDIARLDALATDAGPHPAHPLTPREIEVLELVAAGKTNRAIAAELSLSERTIDRHVSNILTKLDVPSRAAATAYAYENDLL